MIVTIPSVQRATWGHGTPVSPASTPSKSHINFCVYDSAWEASESFELDHNPAVTAWVKNDHLGFEVLYVYRGVVRKYRPDFLIRLSIGCHVDFGSTKGQRQRSRPNQTPVSRRMGQRRQRPWRLRSLDLGRIHGARRHPGYPRATFVRHPPRNNQIDRLGICSEGR